jgi:hypothetical protein
MILKFVAVGTLLATAAGLVTPLVSVAKGQGECEARQSSKALTLDAEQTSNLAVIVGVGDHYGVGEAGKVIAVMTALTESLLRNTGRGDAAGPDSRGLFQQRDGWGPVEVRTDPAGAAGLFYTALANVPGWTAMKPWAAAQEVQRSAFADGSNYRSNFEAAVQLVGSTLVVAGCASWEAGDTDKLPGAEAAVRRALDLVGSRGYYQLCARLASNIWGRSNSGYYSAAEQWSQMVTSGNAHPDDRQPPVGALLFWSTEGPYGHVAVYVGNGQIVSNDIGDRAPGEGGVYLVEVDAIDKQWGATYLGWAPPIYPTT